ncbi:uncharacterized protein LOC142349956 [Convolutriloba macropyga]|uniref:uncharacterized protein LOC142349956 n=1 Tax=Convolutriloba macropyga TaxID=536237 RepID=UPI003F51DC9D
MLFVIILQYLISTFASIEAARGSVNRNRESLDFVLPDHKEELGRKCLQYSLYFCVMRYWIQGKQSERSPEETDVETFKEMVLPVFKEINWYSFQQNDKTSGGCCGLQSTKYIELGQHKGVSPAEYIRKITDFSSDTKQLVFIKVRHEPDMCMNVVTQVGFGKGTLKKLGVKPATHYLIPPLGRSKVHIILANDLTKVLTFSWFKTQVICHEKPWMCDERSSEASSSSGNSTAVGTPLGLLPYPN